MTQTFRFTRQEFLAHLLRMVEEVREQKGYSQRHYAEVFGVSRKAIAKALNGFDTELLLRIYRYLAEGFEVEYREVFVLRQMEKDIITVEEHLNIHQSTVRPVTTLE